MAHQESKKLAFANEKGGVGKTSTTAIEGMILSLLGFETLVIDCDPQAHLSSLLGYPRRTLTGKNMYDVLLGEQTLEEILLPTYIHPENMEFYNPHSKYIGEDVQPRRGPYLAPITLAANNADFELKSKIDYWNEQMKDALATVAHRFAYVLIDCAPSLGALTTNALTASDYICIPVVPERLVIEGLHGLLGAISQTRRKANPSLEVAGVFLSKTQNWNAHLDVTEELKRLSANSTEAGKLHLPLLTTEIKQNASFADSTNHNTLIVLDKPESEYARAYWYLLDELLQKIGGPAQNKVATVVATLKKQDQQREEEKRQKKQKTRNSDGTL